MICGFDEAGRGPLAGPVCAAAVILPEDFSAANLLADSKRLSPARREKAREAICRDALAWGIGWASEAEIDRVNILQASLLAMERAYGDLLAKEKEKAGRGLPEEKEEKIEGIVDGLYVPSLKIPCRAMVKADAQVPEVMAASILAKTARDRLMELYGALYPEYGYDRHKGYPTRAHREALAAYGPSPIQRLSFRRSP